LHNRFVSFAIGVASEKGRDVSRAFITAPPLRFGGFVASSSMHPRPVLGEGK
jgi:hypothetical protein